MLGISILTDMKECQLVTSGIKNCRFSRLFKCCSPSQLLCSLSGNRPQTATFHTANPLRCIKNLAIRLMKLQFKNYTL